MNEWSEPDSLRVGDTDLPLWPRGQDAELLSEEPTIVSTRFADEAVYRAALVERLLELEGDPAHSHRMPTGGSKVRHLDQWNSPEAGLLNARAMSLYGQVTSDPAPEVVLSWASIYRSGDYLGPHGHDRATATIVYCLDAGDADFEQNPYAGRLVFADPRIGFCCSLEEQVVTRTLNADLREGTMVLFPGPIVHFVHPYNGRRPRITLSWNLS